MIALLQSPAPSPWMQFKRLAMAIPAHGPVLLESVPGAHQRVHWLKQDGLSGKSGLSLRPRGGGKLDWRTHRPLVAASNWRQ